MVQTHEYDKLKNILNSMKKINETLCRIAGVESIDRMFGEPFIRAFAQVYGEENEMITIAGYTCSIFLSCILNGFPTEKLRIFVNSTKEEYSRFTFNCNMYEKIYSLMSDKEVTGITLFGKDGHTESRSCTKQEVFEAFDFYTNR